MTGTSGVVMITGASGRLARAVAHHLAHEGWQLALVTRDIGNLVHHPAEPQARWIEADVSTAKGANAAIRRCAELTNQIPSALVNCAGSVLLKSVQPTSVQQYRDMISANLNTNFYTLQAFAAACRTADQQGAAVLVGPVTARISETDHEAIAVGQAAVQELVRSTAATYAGQRIRVNTVAPGPIRTPATEGPVSTADVARQIDDQYLLGRYGQANDIARAIVWLLSDEATWITGQTLTVDGGYSAIRPLQRAN